MQKLVKLILVLAVTTGILWAVKKFIKTDFFAIKTIELKGDNESLKADIIDKINNLKEKNIVYIDVTQIENLLKNDIRVEKVKIEKVYPSKLKINLDERKSYVYVKKGNQIYIADKQLNLFGLISEIKEKSIPIVMYDDENTEKDMKVILSKMNSEELYDVISEIKKEGNEYKFVLLDGTEIVTDIDVDSDRYEKVFKLYDQIRKRQNVSSMDIRFKDITVR